MILNRFDIFLEGEDVLLCSISKEHIEKLRKWRNKEEIRKNFLNTDIISAEQQNQWFSSYIKKDNDIMFIIKDKKNQEEVGAIALYNIDSEKKQAEYGRLMIGEESAKGKGIALKSIKLMLDFAFNELLLDKVYMDVFTENYPSININKKLGFKETSNKKEKGRILQVLELIKGDYSID